VPGRRWTLDVDRHQYADPDPNPTFHSVANPDPDPVHTSSFTHSFGKSEFFFTFIYNSAS
jgi:hypothetical protein